MAKKRNPEPKTRLPTEQEVIDLEKAEPGTSFDGEAFDRKFLNRMQTYGFLDPELRRTTSYERLRRRYEREGLVLFLGAGVSQASGIPGWRRLIESMLDDLGFGAAADGADGGESSRRPEHEPRPSRRPGREKSPERSREQRAGLSRELEQEAGLSLLSQFDLVAHECEGSDKVGEFVRKLRRHLYGAAEFERLRGLLQAIPVDRKEKLRHDWGPIVEELRSNATLAAVGDLLLEHKNGKPAVNPLVHGVLTTNVDNLLQCYVMARAGGRRILNTVDRPSVADQQGMISVYHLHGWLDMRERRASPIVEPHVVFRESEYYDTIGHPAAFANYTAQSLFQRRSVLFVGMSMEDLNIRRWLYTSFEERKRHYAAMFKARYGDDDNEYLGAEAEAYAASIRHFWFKRRGDVPEPRDRIEKFVADSMRHLGVEVIWYDEHAEIADRLRGLRGGG